MRPELRRLIVKNPEHVALLREKATQLGIECEVIVDPDEAAAAGADEADRINRASMLHETELQPEVVARNAGDSVRLGGAVLLLSTDDRDSWAELNSYYRELLQAQ